MRKRKHQVLVKNVEHSHTAGRVHIRTTLENWLYLLKLNIDIPYDLGNLLLSIYPTENTCNCSTEVMGKNAHSRTIHNCPNVGKTHSVAYSNNKTVHRNEG